MPADKPAKRELTPTKTRLALLDAVRRGLVYESNFFPYASINLATGARQKVNSAIETLHRAKWVELDAYDPDAKRRPWKLTAKGRKILAKGTS